MRHVSCPALLLGCSLSLLITGCSQAPETARHTVPQYRADAELRRQQLTVCTSDPGTLAQTPDCVNAREAEKLESLGSLRDRPSIGLMKNDREHDKTEAERKEGAPPN